MAGLLASPMKPIFTVVPAHATSASPPVAVHILSQLKYWPNVGTWWKVHTSYPDPPTSPLDRNTWFPLAPAYPSPLPTMLMWVAMLAPSSIIAACPIIMTAS